MFLAITNSGNKTLLFYSLFAVHTHDNTIAKSDFVYF